MSRRLEPVVQLLGPVALVVAVAVVGSFTPAARQLDWNGSGRRGSPRATMALVKRAVTCRIALTSPCGAKNSTAAGGGDASDHTIDG